MGVQDNAPSKAKAQIWYNIPMRKTQHKSQKSAKNTSLKKPLRRQLFHLTSPIFFETLLLMLTGATDVFMLSRFSDDAVAASGVVNQLVFLVCLVYMITTLGTSVLCAQYLGAKQQKNVLQVIGVSLLLNLVMGILVSAGLYGFAPQLLHVMGIDPNLMQHALPYMKVVGGSSFLLALAMTLGAILRSHNKAYYPMWSALIINVLNVIGNYFLIFGHGGFAPLGITGAGISTLLCRLVAVGILYVILFRKVSQKPPLAYFQPFPWDKVKNLLIIGLPAAGENVSYDLSQVVITYFTVLLGTAALTTRTYTMHIVMFSYVFAMAIGHGASITIGHLIGRARNHAAFSLEKYSIRWALWVSVIISLITALLGRQIFGFLSQNPDVIRMGVCVLWVDVLLEIGRAVNITAVNSLIASGDVFFPFITGVLVMWGVATLFAYILGVWLGWGLVGIWLAMTLDELIRAAIFERRWRSRKWENKSFTR